MAEYLGEFPVDIESSKFKGYKPFDWAMYFIEHYGQIDGSDHKNWVMDQVARIYNGMQVDVVVAKWDNGYEEYRVNIRDDESEEYKKWVTKMEYPEGEDARDEEGDSIYYEYDPGVAP